ncbi:MAG: 3-oxoacyl-ACP reductase [Rhizobiales bacterium]|nr:3-oxoacyl-ACP reductase [Hyphomicrobiales bacterium]|tara:strand:- start:9338 stop:10249 length:912 start_codon:yes stop_codon:yes gene_type:complete
MKKAGSLPLAGRVVMITGAGRGIGRAAALAMAAAGAAVLVNDVDADAAQAVVQAIEAQDGRAAPYIAAIGSADAADAGVARAIEVFGRLDVMACNAGILRDRVLWNTTDEDFDAVIETHLRGTFTCARAAARHFRQAGQGGRLILVSSIAGQRGNFGQTAYSAAKAGIAGMARTWALELKRYDVTVNAIVPNALTAMTQTVPALALLAEMLEKGEPVPPKFREEWGIGGPDDVAPAFVYLASDHSFHVTGQCIGIGGDRMSIWTHPREADYRLRSGGWTADTLAEALEGSLGEQFQDVGIEFN